MKITLLLIILFVGIVGIILNFWMFLDSHIEKIAGWKKRRTIKKRMKETRSQLYAAINEEPKQ